MLAERALTLTVQEESLRMFYFFLSGLSFLDSINACSENLWDWACLSVSMNTPLCEQHILFSPRLPLLNNAWVKSIISGVLGDQCSCHLMHLTNMSLPQWGLNQTKMCLRRSFLERIKMLMLATYRIFCHKQKVHCYILSVIHSLIAPQLLLSCSYKLGWIYALLRAPESSQPSQKAPSFSPRRVKKAFTLAVTWWKVGTRMLWVHNVQYVWVWCAIHISNRKWYLLTECLCMLTIPAKLPAQGGSALLQGGAEHRRRDVQQRERWTGTGGILGPARPEGAPQRLHQVQSSAG